jgi:hypothetical protein
MNKFIPVLHVSVVVLVAFANAQTIHIGARETVYTSAQLSTIPMTIPSAVRAVSDSQVPLLIDAPLATLRKDGGTMTFFSTNGHAIDRYDGTPERPFGPGQGKAGRGRVQWVEWVNRDISYRLSGPRERNVNTLRYDTKKRCWIDYTWIPNIYKVKASDAADAASALVKEGDLFAFVHVETMPAGAGTPVFVFSIGCAYSADTGRTWVYCGDIIRTACNSGNGTNNIGGIPSMVYTDSQGVKWFYAYFNDFADPDWYNKTPKDFHNGKRQCVARAPVNDALVKARNIYGRVRKARLFSQKDVPVFHKYAAEGVWSEKSAVARDTGAQIIPKCPGIPVPFPFSSGLSDGGPDSLLYDFHSDAAYCRPLGKYLITVSNGPDPRSGFGALLLYSSIDGIHWGDPVIVDSAAGAQYIEKPHSFFASLDPDASDDCSEVGKRFYILYPFSYYWLDPRLPAGKQWTLRKQELFRRLITIGPG